MKTNLEKNMEAIFNLPTDTKSMIESIEESRVTIMEDKPISSNKSEIDKLIKETARKNKINS